MITKNLKMSQIMKENQMKTAEKKMLLKHINKDSKEFKSQLKEDKQLKKQILAKPKGKK